jgi:hypothetical protein
MRDAHKGLDRARGRSTLAAIAVCALITAGSLGAPTAAHGADAYGRTYAGQAACLSCHGETAGRWQVGRYLGTAHSRSVTDVQAAPGSLIPTVGNTTLWPSPSTGGGLTFRPADVRWILGDPGGTRQYLSVYRNDTTHTLSTGVDVGRVSGPADDWWSFTSTSYDEVLKAWRVSGKPGVRIYFQSCGGCHFTGVTRSASATYTLPGGAQMGTATPTAFAGTGIECEACHGTGVAAPSPSGHATSGVNVVRTKRALESQTCGQCHATMTSMQNSFGGTAFSNPNGFTTDKRLTDFVAITGAPYVKTSSTMVPPAIPTTDKSFYPSGHNRGMSHGGGVYNEWALSAHARTLRYSGGAYWTGSPRETCLPCHSGEGFLKSIGYGAEGPNDIGALPSKLASNTLDVECAVCHTVHAKTGDAQGLRLPPGELCGACHSARIAPGATALPGSRPRYGSKEMLAGHGLIGVPRSTRPFMGDATCVDCHMPQTRSGYTSHRFTPMLPGDAEAWGVRVGGDSCTPCHAAMTRASLQQDVDGWQSDTTARIAAAYAAIAAAQSRSASATAAGKLLIGSAQTNVWFVEGDASLGVHNPPYIAAGLTKASFYSRAVGASFPRMGVTAFDPYHGLSVAFGRLVLGDGSVPAGEPVVIEALPGGTSAWVVAATAVTDANGDFAAAVYPTGTTEYRARWAALAGAEQYSPSARVTFASSTTLKASVSRVRRGRYVTLSGVVSPGHAGRTVTVQYRSGSRGPWRTLSIRLLGAGSAYSVRVRLRSRGDYYYRASFPGDDSHTGSMSGTVRVRAY